MSSNHSQLMPANSSIGWNGKSMSSTTDTAHFIPRKTPFRDGIKPHRQGRPAHNDMPGTAKSQKHNNRSRSCESPAAPPTANTGLALSRIRKTRQFADSLTELRPPSAKLRALACLIVFKLEAWAHRASQQRPRAARTGRSTCWPRSSSSASSTSPRVNHSVLSTPRRKIVSLAA